MQILVLLLKKSLKKIEQNADLVKPRMGNITSKYSLKIWNVFYTAFYKDESFVGLLTNLLTVLMDKFLEFSLADFF